MPSKTGYTRHRGRPPLDPEEFADEPRWLSEESSARFRRKLQQKRGRRKDTHRWEHWQQDR